MKKIYSLILTLVLMLLTGACAKNVNISNETGNNLEENTNAENELNEDLNKVDEIVKSDYLTGEIITDGIYGNTDVYYIFFIPDKETRQLLNNDYPLEIGESIPLKFESMDIIKDLPKELGIYNVAIEADFTGNIWGTDLKSIKLTDDIGTVEYQGKTYETNDLDENVQPKDRVGGLIVENVRRLQGD